MRPKDLSEFSYGYALTESIVGATPLKAAPFFPSLIEEGKKGGGYDVKISFAGYLVYLQFKLADRMERRSALETKNGIFEPPFFRMPLRSSAKSDQHAMLIELEGTERFVYYAAPMFSTAKELDEAYLGRKVVRRTRFFRPSEIGPLPDDKSHWVSFGLKGSVAYFCSETPRKLDAKAMLDGRALLAELQRAPLRPITPASLSMTAKRMKEIVVKELLYGPYRKEHPIEGYREMSPDELRVALQSVPVDAEVQLEVFTDADEVEEGFSRLEQERNPAEQVAYLARTFFGCEVLRIEK